MALCRECKEHVGPEKYSMTETGLIYCHTCMIGREDHEPTGTLRPKRD